MTGQKRGPGRPPFKPTDEQREMVKDLVAIGTPAKEIALLLRIGEPGLQKHFEQELKYGRVERRAEAVGLLFKQARDGNLSALTKVEQMTSLAATARPIIADLPRKAAAASLAAPPPPPPPPPPPKPEKLGKKEQAKLDAANPDTSTTMGDLMARRRAEQDGSVH